MRTSLTPDPSPAIRARGNMSAPSKKDAGIPLPTPGVGVRKAARDNRKSPTKSERLLWKPLRNRSPSTFKFRRQHPVDSFILDFYCPEQRLAIEVDGPIHRFQTRADAIRQEALESLGIRFLRLPADLVETDTSEALRLIEAALTDRPSPAHGRGVGGEK